MLFGVFFVLFFKLSEERKQCEHVGSSNGYALGSNAHITCNHVGSLAPCHAGIHFFFFVQYAYFLSDAFSQASRCQSLTSQQVGVSNVVNTRKPRAPRYLKLGLVQWTCAWLLKI